MSAPTDPPADLEDRVVALGREGLGRVEIAERLGLTADEVVRLEAERPGLRRALQLAETAARAWWEGQAREALRAGVRFNTAGWLAAMRWRFGDGPAAEAACAAAAEAKPRVIIDLPDNGRERKYRHLAPAAQKAATRRDLVDDIAYLEGQLGNRRDELECLDEGLDDYLFNLETDDEPGED